MRNLMAGEFFAYYVIRGASMFLEEFYYRPQSIQGRVIGYMNIEEFNQGLRVCKEKLTS